MSYVSDETCDMNIYILNLIFFPVYLNALNHSCIFVSNLNTVDWFYILFSYLSINCNVFLLHFNWDCFDKNNFLNCSELPHFLKNVIHKSVAYHLFQGLISYLNIFYPFLIVCLCFTICYYIIYNFVYKKNNSFWHNCVMFTF